MADRPPRSRRRRAPRLPEGTEALLRRALREDRAREDLTTLAIVPARVEARAVVIAEANGVASGVGAAVRAGRLLGLRVTARVVDGSTVRRGEVVLEIAGDLRAILAAERTMVNLLMHLSGVATATRSAVRRAAGRLGVRGTRKTIPGLRALEKAAIVDGGGAPHRPDLAGGLLVKSTHLEQVPLEVAIGRLRAAHGRRPVQVEVRGRSEALRALAAGADALLLDNLGPSAARRVVRAVRSRPGGRAIPIELSGGITPETIARYRSTGADAASLGAITHSAPALAFHLRLVGRRSTRRAPGARR